MSCDAACIVTEEAVGADEDAELVIDVVEELADVEVSLPVVVEEEESSDAATAESLLKGTRNILVCLESDTFSTNDVPFPLSDVPSVLVELEAS